jgi:hypothetical protein
MVSRSYSSDTNAATPVTKGQADCFDFSNVVLTSSPSESHGHAARSMKFRDLHDTDTATTQYGTAAPLTVKTTSLKKSHFFGFCWYWS